MSRLEGVASCWHTSRGLDGGAGAVLNVAGSLVLLPTLLMASTLNVYSVLGSSPLTAAGKWDASDMHMQWAFAAVTKACRMLV